MSEWIAPGQMLQSRLSAVISGEDPVCFFLISSSLVDSFFLCFVSNTG